VKINIRDIAEGGLVLQLSGEDDILSESLARRELRVTINPRVWGRLQIVNDGGETLFFGIVEGAAHLPCSRCLSEFRLALKVSPHLVIRRGDVQGRVHAESGEEEADAVFIEGEEIDIGEILVQELLLEIPMKPLCRDDCPGLCPRCGALKGSPECQCPAEPSGNQRWAVLSRLKDQVGP
jgi:uncharacterized protein